MEISKLDHLVLTVKDFEKTVSFYVSVMGKGPNCGAERRRRSRLHSTQWTGRIGCRNVRNPVILSSGHRPRVTVAAPQRQYAA